MHEPSSSKTARADKTPLDGNAPLLSETFKWLFYDDDLNVYGCNVCHSAFSSGNGVRAHIRSNNSPHDPSATPPIDYCRKIKKKGVAISSISSATTAVAEDGVSPDWAAIYHGAPHKSAKLHKPVLDAVPWLSLHDGFQCALCTFCHRLKPSVESHMQKEHPTEYRYRRFVLCMRMKPKLVQTLFLGNKARYFPVVLRPNATYWFTGIAGDRRPGSQLAARSTPESAAESPPSSKTCDEIASLCEHYARDGSSKRHAIFDELRRANTVLSQKIGPSPDVESDEVGGGGFGTDHTHSAFLALTRFDLMLRKCGFSSFQQVPLDLFATKGSVSSDCSFNALQEDILGYLGVCGSLVYDSAPHIRDMIQLTGYAGENLRKFKPVEMATLKKYSSYVAQILLVALRAFSETSCASLQDKGRRLFPKDDTERFKSLTTAYVASFSRPHPKKWTELSELLAALCLVSVPGESSTDNIPIGRILAVLSVTQAGTRNGAHAGKYLPDGEEHMKDQAGGVPDEEAKTGSGLRRFKSGSEMSHLFASILYCASCTCVYNIRCGEEASEKKLDFARKSLSLKDNTAVALVRDLLDKTTADRNADSAAVRFWLCINNTHENEACGVIDGYHLSLASVRDGLWGLESEMEKTLELDMLQTLPVELGTNGDLITQIRDRHTDSSVGFSFSDMPENKEMTDYSAQALLDHMLRGVASKGGYRIDDKPVSAGCRIRPFFVCESDNHKEDEAGSETNKRVLQVGEYKFFERSIRFYLQKCQRFLQLLLVYVHITGGGPPRCTEVCTMRVKNGAFDKRNLYIDQALFCFLSRYNKNRSSWEKEVNIARFLPRSLSKMLLVYLLYVRPVENLFSSAIIKRDMEAEKNSGFEAHIDAECERRQNEFLFVSLGDIYSASKVRDVLSREFERLGYALNASQWRHYQNGMEREFMQVMADQSGDGDGCHDAECPFLSLKLSSGNTCTEGDPSQAGHSRRRADLSYARTSRIPRGISYTNYMRHRTNSILWHNLLGICCVRRRSQQVRVLDSEKSPACRLSVSGVTGGAGLVADASQFAKSVAHELKSLLPQKRILDCVENEQGADTHKSKKKRVHFCIDADRDCSTGGCRHQELDLYQEFIPYLRSMTSNPDAEFRSRYQLCAVATALQRKRDMMLILGTGSGKTLLYLLVAYIEGDRAKRSRMSAPLTVVIVPTRALVQDVLKRCSAMGVVAVRWNERNSCPGFESASIIVLAIEQVLLSDYAPFLENMGAQGRLARIVSEECHLMTQWENFRPQLNQIRHHIFGNATVPIPIIMASATVSPALEQSVIDAHAADPARLSVIREPTYRDNISYSVLYTSSSTAVGRGKKKPTEVEKMSLLVIDSIVNALEDSIFRGPPGPRQDLRVLVYCPTKDICRTVRKLIGTHAAGAGRDWRCALYTADMDPQDKDDVFEFWVEERERKEETASRRNSEAFFVAKESGRRARIVVATSAFGTGIDVPDVRLVFHVGFCRGLYSFAQESGRAGRDGRAAKSMTVFSSPFLNGYTHGLKERCLKETGTEESAELSAIMEFRSWASQFKQCRRKLLFESLDPEAPPSCLVSRYKNADVALCDCCQLADSIARCGLGDTAKNVRDVAARSEDGGDIAYFGDARAGNPTTCRSAAAEDDASATAAYVGSGGDVDGDVAAALAAVSVDLTNGIGNATGELSEAIRTPPRKYRALEHYTYGEISREQSDNIRLMDGSGKTENNTNKQKLELFMGMARKLKGACAICLVLHLRNHKGREKCLAGSACFNCFATGMNHTLKECPLKLETLLKMPERSCSACGLNMCMGRRLHKKSEWNWRDSCPYRAIIEMFFVAWRTPYIRRDLCAKLDRAGIYTSSGDFNDMPLEQSEQELPRYMRCVSQTIPGRTLPNIIEATRLLFETIGFEFNL